MSTVAGLPTPDFTQKPQTPKRILWKWSLALTAVLLTYLMWQCGSALYSASKLADEAVRHFHVELNNAQYDQICAEADEGFSEEQKHNELLRFLEAVHRKLGNAGESAKRVNLRVNATSGGTFVIAQFTSQFSQGQATETFTWRKRGDTLKLYQYNVISSAFLN